MSMEKPWKEAHQELLNKLNASWGGEIIHSRESDSLDTSRTLPADMFLYAEWRGERQGLLVNLKIGDFPTEMASLWEGDDGVEYLSILVTCETRASSLFMRPKDWTDRLKQTFGIDSEFKVGNRGFDRDYWLVAESDDDREILRDGSVRSLVYQLEPFTSIHIFSHGLSCSREITEPEVLDATCVQGWVERLVALARSVE